MGMRLAISFEMRYAWRYNGKEFAQEYAVKNTKFHGGKKFLFGLQFFMKAQGSYLFL
jgi:hypothetical protein